jgi:hypothetical protein
MKAHMSRVVSCRVVSPEWLRTAGAAQSGDIKMTTKENRNAEDEVTYLAGVQKYCIGYLLSLFGNALLIVVELCTAAAIAMRFPWILMQPGP